MTASESSALFSVGGAFEIALVVSMGVLAGVSKIEPELSADFSGGCDVLDGSGRGRILVSGDDVCSKGSEEWVPFRCCALGLSRKS